MTFEQNIFTAIEINSDILYGSETCALRKLERKYFENLEMWCWSRMEKIKLSGKVTNEEFFKLQVRRGHFEIISYVENPIELVIF